MLTDIHIENFTIIDQLSLELEDGMTAITGETGAGKSIIVDALSYALGNRADSAVVRNGADKADITATFYIASNASATSWLSEHEINIEDNSVIMRRVIAKDGRSKAYINGKPTTLSLQKQLGQILVDIHGQHEYHQLLNTEYQANIMDRYAKHPVLLNAVSDSYEAWNRIKKRLKKIQEQSKEFEDKKELLSYQVQELDEAGFSQEELSSLDQDYKKLANAQEIQAIAWTTLQTLQDSESASMDTVSSAISQVEKLAECDPQYQSAVDSLNQAYSLIDDATREINALSNDVELDQESLDYLESRIALAHELSRKHRIAPEQLAELHQKLTAELAQLEAASEDIESIHGQLDIAWQNYCQHSYKLSQSRLEAANILQAEITPIIQQLGMQHGHIEFAINYQSESKSATGQDLIEILVSTNPDQPLQPLAQVASGGELSRISLAIEVITLDKQTASTLIFDEVDVGIGGGTAEIVGQLLRRVSKDLQVLCITHQAQVAGQAHQHLVVQKSHVENKTSSQLNYLSQAQRIEEMARMLGGINITDSTRSTAKELLLERE